MPRQDVDLDAQAQTALDEARATPPGPERIEALRKAGNTEKRRRR